VRDYTLIVWLTAVVLFTAVYSVVAPTLLERAEAALHNGDLSGAEAGFRAHLSSEEASVDALYGLGWVYHLEGDDSRARDYFTSCVRVDPEDYRGPKGLGSVAMGVGNIALARSYFERALELSPGEPSVVNSLALTLSGQERFEEAIELLRPLVLSWPERGEFGLNLADSLSRMGEYDEALEVIESSLAVDISEARFRALFFELRARIILAMTAGRIEPGVCGELSEGLLEYLRVADSELDSAERLSPLPDISAVRLMVHRRRSALQEYCLE
jgi:tetratricopeptide (TPR) repeat protein